MALTDKKLKSIKATGQGYELADSGGLCVRVSPKGKIVFQYRFRHQGKNQRMRLGEYPVMTLKEARDAHRKAKAILDQGNNPILVQRIETAKQRTVLLMEEVIQEFIERDLRKNRLRPDQPERVLNKDVLPVIGDIPAHLLQRAHVNKIIDRVLDRGAPIMANRTLTLLGQLFRYAIQRGYMEHNLTEGITKRAAGGNEATRERNLANDEIATLLQNLPSWRTHESNKLAIRFLLASGQRITAVLEASWDEFDLEAGVWTIPAASKARHTKSKKPRALPISGYMAEILHQQKQHSAGLKYVWAGIANPHTHVIKDALNTVVKRANYAGLPQWQPHDLRRTVSTRLGDLGIMPHITEKIAGHSMPGVMAVYNRHDYFAEQRDALEKWGERLRLLENPPANIIPLERPAG